MSDPERIHDFAVRFAEKRKNPGLTRLIEVIVTAWEEEKRQSEPQIERYAQALPPLGKDTGGTTMQQWEYRITTYLEDQRLEGLDEGTWLNCFGNEGWELHQRTRLSESVIEYVFKRPLRDDVQSSASPEPT